jgi:thiol:disulfide interchange protein
MPAATHQIAWTHDFDRALADAKAQRKLVLVDFTAAPM